MSRRCRSLSKPTPVTSTGYIVTGPGQCAPGDVFPTVVPTAEPTSTPTVALIAKSTSKPTAFLTAEPTSTSTAAPTAKPTSGPTAAPTGVPALQCSPGTYATGGQCLPCPQGDTLHVTTLSSAITGTYAPGYGYTECLPPPSGSATVLTKIES